MSFDVFINGPGLNGSMPGHSMAQSVVLAKPERENDWKSAMKSRFGVALRWL
jgi:hypothetical protein